MFASTCLAAAQRALNATFNRTSVTEQSPSDADSLHLPSHYILPLPPPVSLSHWENVNQQSIITLENKNSNNETRPGRSGTDETSLVVGDLSCLKNGFHPAPVVLNANIKYLR